MEARSTRDRIVDAAEEFVNVHGPQKLTIDRVAAASGVHRATVHRQFPGGRDELLTAVVSRVARHFMGKLAAHVADEADLTGAIVEALVYTVEETFKHSTLALLFAPDTAGRTGAAAATSRAIQEIATEMWGPLVEAAKADGTCREDLSLDELVELLLRLIFSLLLSSSQSTRSRADTKAFLRNVIAPYVAKTTYARVRPAASEPAFERSTRRSRRPLRPDSDNRAVSERLLEVAAALFTEKGYQHASTRELADRLGVTQPTLYHHFGSKEELLEQVCLEGLRRMDDALAPVLAISDGAIPDLIREYLRTLIRNRDLHLSRVLELDSLGPARQRTVRGKEQACEALLRAVIAREQNAGRLRSDMDCEQLLQALLSLVNWTMLYLEPLDDEGVMAAAEDLTDVYLNGAGMPPLSRPLGEGRKTATGRGAVRIQPSRSYG